MPWKMDGDKIVVDNGNPVWITSDNRETTIQGDTITRLNAEAKSHRERAEKVEGDLKKFEGIADPEAAKKALDTVKDIDAKKLIDSGKLDELKNAMNKEWGDKHAAEVKRANELAAALDNERITNAFASSSFVKDRVAVPAEMFQAVFGKHLKVEDGKVIAVANDGKTPLLSRKSMGEPADVDEAFEILLENYPGRDTILKAAPAKGSGNGGGGGNPGGAGTMRRADFQALAPQEQMAKSADLRAGTLKLVD